ncbi:peptidyl-prolyl cis-trans isomerase B (cyclophilin B) [Raineyella antarctica]|uniref:Peptidyl-prolyl cis-trans isomerase B (Cyclophilin B) n=1 Tax=Raineyella antarctica TaxID=1577474 RepID=A0A1G6GUB8_9ACTN|nr:peptidylprolyl isomerase [Raineyella antarctica]SDB85548.1 peptidyl-prolyl cis-trans isomerase B (cyclophilin B) [Raineyella antarctica]
MPGSGVRRRIERRVRTVSALALAGLAAVALGACAPRGNEAAAPAAGSAPTAATTGGAPAATSTVATVTCSYRPSGEPAKPVDPPPAQAPSTGSAAVTLSFAVGDVVVTMDRATAPCATNSFESLAAQGFYTDTACHRLADNGLFMLQCGDPTGTGMGGPGYRFVDEVDPATVYTAGTVAMANAGADTNGSQFFLVYQDSRLPPRYTVLGHMDQASTGVVTRIAAEGQDGSNADGTGRPNNAARITAVKLG